VTMTSETSSPIGSVVSRTASLTTAVRVIRIASWVFLALGVVASLSQELSLVVAAATCGAMFAVSTTAIRVQNLAPSGIILQILSLAGAILTMAAVALTGGPGSPFTVLAMMPSLLASMIGGYRIGLATSLLSAGLLTAMTLTAADFDALVSSAGTIGLFPLVALLVAQIRALMIEAVKRADHLEAATAEAEAELERLGQANDLLRRLTDLYAEGSTNPVDVGRAAIEAIVESQPGSFATATLFDSQGPVVVARAGTDAADLVKSQFPLGDGLTTSGVVSIGTPRELSPQEREEIERLLRPVAVSFSNAVLLQEIAGEAVREERLRLARELHDEVGPALAALGFSLDSATMQANDPSLQNELTSVREALGTVVDDLRGIIADLRSDESGSLTSALLSSLANLEPPPEIKVDVHERRPPRSTAGRQILAILTEATRNAYRHAEATSITVTGLVDRDQVEAEVIDDGKGFDPTRLPEGHYGVMGMRERADRIGATVEIDSGDSGTTVRVVWKEKR
jgi:signal transduction histidine kinase